APRPPFSPAAARAAGGAAAPAAGSTGAAGHGRRPNREPRPRAAAAHPLGRRPSLPALARPAATRPTPPRRRRARRAAQPRPAAALVSLLALQLLDKERPRHVNDFTFAAALGLFAGLNVLPKKSLLTASSCRCDRPPQRARLAGGVAGLSGRLFAQADT